MNLSQLKSFLAVVDTGSFGAASRELGISQPAVSQHVRKLEQSLEVCLIERGTVCVPTHRAVAFVRHARTLIEIAERARLSLHSDELRVGASSNVGTYLIQPIFAQFMNESEIKGKLTIASNPEVAEKLQQGEIDVAAMEWWNEADPESRRFHNEIWREEPLVLIVGPGHRWAGRRLVQADLLEEENLLGGESGTGTGRVISEGFGSIAGKLKVTQVLGSTEVVKEGVKAGLGVSLVLRSAVKEELEAGSLYQVNLRGIKLKKRLQLITSSNLPETSCARKFCEYAMKI
ncbi:MAG: LysR family transcriptional regulator [Verrucomicrobiales bacterium]|nr:LysR family transcriptional regulator [Verrucomicrobiales bacterium]